MIYKSTVLLLLKIYKLFFYLLFILKIIVYCNPPSKNIIEKVFPAIIANKFNNKAIIKISIFYLHEIFSIYYTINIKYKKYKLNHIKP